MAQFKKYKLGDLVAQANTGLDAIKRAPIVEHDTGVKCLRIQDVSQSKDFKDWGFTEVSKENYTRFSLKAGEIIVARTGNTIGVNIFISKDLNSVFNNGLIRLRVDRKLCDPKYLYYNLQTIDYWAHIDSIAFGTSTQPNMQIESFLSFEINKPNLPTQTRIASILSALDDKIELNRRTNATLEAMEQTLFKKYFVDDIDPDNLPEGWRWGKLSEVTSRITKGTTPTTLKKEFVSSGINFLKVENLTEVGTFDKSKLNFIDEETDQLLSRSRIQNKDILFSIAGTLGRIALVNESILPANTNQALAIIRPEINIIEPLYIFYWLKLPNIREQIFSKSVQGVQANLSLGVLSDIDIIVPAKDFLLEKFVIINTIYDKIESNENEAVMLSKIRDSLLPKLMSGEINVSVAEEELINQ
jgi:type I restriction enzyme S subunit